jgi:uncharacterized membrane protein
MRGLGGTVRYRAATFAAIAMGAGLCPTVLIPLLHAFVVFKAAA